MEGVKVIEKELEKYKAYDEITPEVGLRDKLAVDRTVLAKERTDLAYFRTAVSFIVAAITLYKLFDGNAWGISTALILIVSAIYVSIRGIKVSMIIKKRLNLK